MNRILTVQDISCVGKCSLTVALPIISAMGVECAILPTAVLSTHTMFRGYTFRDLTEDLDPIIDHWQKEGLDFSAVYTGYLGSREQLAVVARLFEAHRDAVCIVDPVMADNGKLYPGFTEEFAKDMAALCSSADIILPNLTEASFMLGVPYPGTDYDEGYIKDMLKKLAALGPKVAVLTGVSFEEGKLGVMAYDREKDEFFYYCREHLPAAFHGTGDIFASAFTGALTENGDYREALRVAADYTVECIALTLSNPEHVHYGVEFERAIPYLCKRIGKG